MVPLRRAWSAGFRRLFPASMRIVEEGVRVVADGVLLLNNQEIGAVLDVEDCFEPLETAFRALGRGEAASIRRRDVLSPVPALGVVHGFKCMGGVVPDLDAACLRTDSDLLSWPEAPGGARRVKLTPAQDARVRIGKENGLLLLYRISTGELLALMTDGEVQRLRVGVTSALAARYLSRPESARVGFLGSGYQAETQLRALAAVRRLSEVRVYSPDPGHRADFARRMQAAIGCPVVAVDGPEEACGGADIITSATNSITPTIRPEWLRPGVHVNCIKVQEIDAPALARCDLVFAGSSGHTETTMVGSLERAAVAELAEGWWTSGWESYPFLATLIAGRHPGRTSPDQVTCYVGHGTGVQFAALAMVAYQRACERGVGFELPAERFLQPVYQQ